MSDLIDRQAAIDTIADKLDPPHQVDGSEFEKGCAAQWTKDWNVVMRALDKLPSAQPEPCEDAVSREAVIEEIKVCFNMGGCDCGQCNSIIEHINSLPPVTPKPKTGKWVNNIHDLPVCDQCGYMTPYDRAIDDYEYGNYCPNCGAEMTNE